MLMLSAEFHFTPAQVWAMRYGDFVGYAAFVDKLREERARERSKRSRKGRKR